MDRIQFDDLIEFITFDYVNNKIAYQIEWKSKNWRLKN